MPAGGIMFEEVLKRLCPCYYNRKSRKESVTSPDVLEEKLTSKKTLSLTGPLITSLETGFKNTNTTAINTTTITNTSGAQDSWKGTLNLVQPQPVYAFPMETAEVDTLATMSNKFDNFRGTLKSISEDCKKSVKRNQKNLLKPPLYWKKASKSLHLEFPPVFQEIKTKNASRVIKKVKKNKQCKENSLKHSDTVADLSTAATPDTTEVRWLKSQSLDSVFSAYPKRKTEPHVDRRVTKSRKDRKPKLETEGWRSIRSHILPDVSHGIISFTATYFSRKKTCLISIDQLEKLSKKGRDGNTYYSVVKLAILPSEKYIKCTKILANCTNPRVRENFTFSVKELNGKVLRFSVFDASLQKQHEAVGHAFLTLENIIGDQPKKYRIKLYRWSQPHTYPGSLGLSLRYIENEDKLTISADKARNLSLQKDRNVKLNTYVKVTFYSYGEKVKTKKSLIVMDSQNPDYNSTFTFQVRKDQIDYSSVAVTVRLKGFVTDVTIGRLNFGPFFYIDSRKLTPWGRVFLKKEFVSHWFRLYL